MKVEAYRLKNVSATSKTQYIYELYKGVKYSLYQLKPPTLFQVQSKSIQLFQPSCSKQKLVFLELDQTLIFSQKTQNTVQANKISYKISIRPYTFTFLQELSRFYEIFVFTAAAKGYAQATINKINKHKPYIKDFLCRDNCFERKKGKYLKDLRIIKNRGLKDIVILDNRVEVFALQLKNGIPILSFDGKTQDDILLQMIPFLKELSRCQDVRPLIDEKFKLKNLIELNQEQIQSYLKAKQF